MRPHGKTKLGFFPLPVAEAKRLRNWLTFPERFSALDPCVGDGAAFTRLLDGATTHRMALRSTPIGPNEHAPSPALKSVRACVKCAFRGYVMLQVDRGFKNKFPK